MRGMKHYSGEQDPNKNVVIDATDLETAHPVHGEKYYRGLAKRIVKQTGKTT